MFPKFIWKKNRYDIQFCKETKFIIKAFGSIKYFIVSQGAKNCTSWEGILVAWIKQN